MNFVFYNQNYDSYISVPLSGTQFNSRWFTQASYMRMYWGKKILEWTETPEEVYRIAVQLNNKYELDGRDPNGFAGVAWCFGKHDHPWPERRVLGKVRYMNANGLRRKFDAQRYMEQVQALNGAVLND
jgi:deoxyribodipyrimidine photolyase